MGCFPCRTFCLCSSWVLISFFSISYSSYGILVIARLFAHHVIIYPPLKAWDPRMPLRVTAEPDGVVGQLGPSKDIIFFLILLFFLFFFEIIIDSQ